MANVKIDVVVFTQHLEHRGANPFLSAANLLGVESESAGQRQSGREPHAGLGVLHIGNDQREIGADITEDVNSMGSNLGIVISGEFYYGIAGILIAGPRDLSQSPQRV